MQSAAGPSQTRIRPPCRSASRSRSTPSWPSIVAHAHALAAAAVAAAVGGKADPHHLPALSAAEERIPFPRAAVDRERLLELRGVEPARLREERDRVLPDERLDRRPGEATGAKMHHRARHLERIAPS